MLHAIKLRLLELLRDERGASAIEYGLIAALIAALIIASVSDIGTHLQTTFENIYTALTT